MDPVLQMVVDTMRTIVSDNEGAVVELLGAQDGVLEVRYFQGRNEECPECVMPPDSFRQMMLEVLKVQAPYIRDVELELPS